jgi:Holliday junction DNA helicase RuvA
MIAFLRGLVLEKHPNQVIVDAGGVGYDVTVPVSTFADLPETGREVRLHIHTQHSDTAFALYGFLTRTEKQVFERLITVTGIGPRLAVAILSGLKAPDLVAAIRSGSVAYLTRIPGVGKKTAERMVLELRDKLDDLAGGAAAEAPAEAREAMSSVEQDVLSALINLGCQAQAARAALQKARSAGAPDEFEPLFRRAMEHIR